MPEWTTTEAREPAVRVTARRQPDGAVRLKILTDVSRLKLAATLDKDSIGKVLAVLSGEEAVLPPAVPVPTPPSARGSRPPGRRGEPARGRRALSAPFLASAT